MFNLFPKYGSPGDCKSVDDLTGKPATNWFYTSTPTFTINGKTYKADEISKYIGELLTENQGLKNELEGWKIGNKNWRKLYDEKADTVDELLKEVKNLRHLKEENIQLMERVNEIDSDENRELKAEIFTLKNDFAVLKAKYQILDHNYQGCTKYRDEYKHQLNAANKEIEALKSKLRDYQDMYAESFSHNDMNKLQKIIDEQKEELKKLKDDIVDYVIEKDDELRKTQNWNNLKQRKTQKVYVCNHCGYKVGHNTNYFGGCGFCKEGLMIEKEEVVDWMADEGIPNDEEDVQKHPMYPIHWGGWDKVEITTSSTDEWQCPCNKCKDKREGRSVVSWEEAASDLALRVAKLEEQLKYSQKIICPK